MSTKSLNVFSLSVQGQIESSLIPGHDNLYCKFAFHQGPDWTILTGLEQGISQLSKSQDPGFFSNTLDLNPCIWNFPIDVAFKSTNVFGWPTILVTVYGFDFFGRDVTLYIFDFQVVRGYGSLKLPMATGRY
jgi:B9 domain-containing protein 1